MNNAEKVGRIRKLRAKEAMGSRELQSKLLRAQQRIADKIEKATEAPRKLLIARNRDGVYADMLSVYDVLAREIDAWIHDSVAVVSQDWHKEAVTDIKRAIGNEQLGSTLLKFDRERVKTYSEMISPENEKHIAAVFTKSMAEQEIKHLRNATISVIREASIEGLSANEIQKRIQERWNKLARSVRHDRFVDRSGRTWNNADYLRMLTRTTMQRVSRDSYIDTLAKHGDDLVRVVNVGETCPICTAWNGLILSSSGANADKYPTYQQAMDAGMFHPNCVLPGTQLVAPGLKAAMRAYYSGPVVSITFASGRRLSVTVNHMLLGQDGFVTAKMLRSGDYIFRCADSDGMPFITPNNDLGEPVSHNSSGSVGLSCDMATTSVPAAPENLHGDGVSVKGNINIVFFDSLLRGDTDSETLNKLREFGFSCGTETAYDFSCNSTLHQLLAASADASDGRMGSLRLTLASGGAHLSSPNLAGFRMASNWNPAKRELVQKARAAAAERIGKVIEGFSGFVTADRVVDVNITSYDGHVYDLHTFSTMYLANGFLSSNCDCSLERVDEKLDKDEAKRQAGRSNPDELRAVADGPVSAADRAKITEAMQDYSDRLAMDAKIAGGMSEEDAEIDLIKDKLKWNLQVAGMDRFHGEVDRLDKEWLRQMDRKKVPQFQVAPANAEHGWNRDSSRGGIIYLGRDAGDPGGDPEAFKKAFYSLQVKRGLGVRQEKPLKINFVVPKSKRAETKKVLAASKVRFYGVKVKDPEIKKDVEIPMTGIKHALSGNPSPEDVAVIAHLPELIRLSKIWSKEKDRKARKEIKAVYKKIIPVTMNGVEKNVFITIRDTNMGARYYNHKVENIEAHRD